MKRWVFLHGTLEESFRVRVPWYSTGFFHNCMIHTTLKVLFTASFTLTDINDFGLGADNGFCTISAHPIDIRCNLLGIGVGLSQYGQTISKGWEPCIWRAQGYIQTELLVIAKALAMQENG